MRGAGEGAHGSARGGQGGLSVPKAGEPPTLEWEPWEGSHSLPRWGFARQ